MQKCRALVLGVCLLGIMSAPASSLRPSIEDLREEVRQEAISLAKLTQEIVDVGQRQ